MRAANLEHTGVRRMHWYAVNTKAHQEQQAGLYLERLGVQTFCPQLKRTRIIRRRMQAVTGPLFPRYIFAKFDIETCYRKVSYASGVQKIVAFGCMPTPVDEEVIEAIHMRCANGELTVPVTSFKTGQSVRIQDGPLQGLEAVFEREMSDHQRVVLLLQTLAYQARVVVPYEQIVNL